MKGLISQIERCALDDGPGIRTTVYLKGCRLACTWCHNPECQSFAPQLSYKASRCIGCGRCVRACDSHVHSLIGSTHVMDRSLCKECFACAAECHSGALEVVGKLVSPQGLVDQVLEDASFYGSSGGMTVSGGEPMHQFEFLIELLREVKSRGLHICLETSGYAPWSEFEQILALVDLFLYDLKDTDTELHALHTGVSNELILENLFRLDREGASIILRVPLVPRVNLTRVHLERVAEIACSLRNVKSLDVMPFHRNGSAKYVQLGMNTPSPMQDIPALTQRQADRISQRLASRLGISRTASRL